MLSKKKKAEKMIRLTKKNSENSWIVVTTIFAFLVLISDAFNLDTVNFIKFTGTPGSMFGFSVAEHKERGQNWILVGAPEAQTNQPGVTKGGAVFKCDVNRDDACEEILFDNTGNNNNTDGRQIDKKSNQWFGATVRSSGETGIVLACAPRYVWFSTTTAYRRDPVGTCYIAKNYFTEFSEYSPCRTRNWGYHRQGSCQAGLGADVSKDGNRLYVGAPGSWYWQGQIYDITSTFKMPTVSPDYSKNHELNLIEYESGQLYAQNPNKRPEVLATSEGSPQDDDSYLGYSVAAGDFEGRKEGGVAVGMPRGAGLFGKVVLYSVNLTNLQNLTGHQLGSYFSYSLAVIDVDGDELDDIIVGAPLHTDLNNNEGKYETGRVYIYFQRPNIDSYGYYTRFSRYDFKDGKNSKGRFGLSVAALGDINRDGFGDFAVGAPYDGPENRGAVYIYHGKRGGVRETYSQVIRSEDLSVPTSTFGFSIAGGLDMDDNQYPDMIVGAYESDTTLFFRARPVVQMVEARVLFDSKTKQISLEEENCTLRDYTKVPCVNLQTCLKYDGIEVDRQLDINIGIALDSKKPKSPRMFFLDNEGKSVKNDTFRLKKAELLCKSYYVYVKSNIRDKLTPLEAELRYNVKDSDNSQIGLGRRYTRSLSPILNANEINVQKDSLSIQKNCGPDNICIPDLHLTTKKSVSKYLLGSGERFSLDVQVENKGEDAFEAMYNLQIPPGMNYINIERLDSERNIPVQCSAPSSLTNNTLKCDIGNPLPKEKLVHFKVLLQPFHREGMKSSYNFVSVVNSTNPEDEFTSRDNVESFTIPIWVETDLILQGSSHPPDVHYNMSHYSGNIRHEMDIGPQVFHVYNIRNKGPSDVLEAQAVFLWPSYTLSDDHLMYLLEQPETSGNVKCEYVENVNEERIELDRKRKSFLDSAAFSAAQLSGRGGGAARSRINAVGGARGGVGVWGGSATGGAGNANQIRGGGIGAGSFGNEVGKGSDARWSTGGSRSSHAGGRWGEEEKGRGTSVSWRKDGRIAGAEIGGFGRKETESGKSWERGGGASSSQWEGTHTEGTSRKMGGRWGSMSWNSSSEEERKLFEKAMRKGGKFDFESGHGSMPHRTRVQSQSTSESREYESGTGYSGRAGKYGGESISGDKGEDAYRNIINGEDSKSEGADSRVRGSGGSGIFRSEAKSGSSTHYSTSGSKIVDSFMQNKTEEKEGSEGKGFGWKINENGSLVPTDNTGHVNMRTHDERRLQQKPLIFNATGYSRARGKVEGDLNKSLTDSSGVLRKAYNQNEFRTVTLDLTPGTGSNVGINIADGVRTGQGMIENDVATRGSGFIGSEAVATDMRARTREYEEALNRELERRRQEIEKAAVAGFITDINKFGSNNSTEEGSKTNITSQVDNRNEISFTETRNISSGQLGSIDQERNYKIYPVGVGAGKTYQTFDENSYKGNRANEGFSSAQEKIYTSSGEIQRKTLEGEATAASGDRSSDRTRHYQIHGSLFGNGTRIYKVLNNGTEVHKTRYDEDKADSSRKYALIDNMNKENERRRQEVAKEVAASPTFVTPSRGSEYYGGSHGFYNTPTSGFRQFAGIDLREQEERLRREYEIKRQEAEKAARELERIRLESEAGGSRAHSPRLYETIESLRREYEKKRLEAEAAAAAAAAAAEARASGGTISHHYANEYHYRTNSSWSTEGTPRIDAFGRSHVHSGSESSDASYYGPHYVRQFQAGNEDRMRDQTESRFDKEKFHGSGIQYFNTSYFNSGRMPETSRNENVDPDLGYVRTGFDVSDKPSGFGYYRFSEKPFMENLVDENLKIGSRYKKSYDRNKRHPKLLTRFPRQINVNDFDLKSSLSCGPTKCTKIRCIVGPLTRGQEAWVAFRGRVAVDTLKKIGYEREIMLSSLLASQVTKLPHIGEPHNAKVETYEVFSELMPQDVTVKPEVAPLWIIVLSACAGTLILLLLIFLLWKLGFFKRHRPSNTPEKQPLNRNGYHAGDEQL